MKLGKNCKDKWMVDFIEIIFFLNLKFFLYILFSNIKYKIQAIENIFFIYLTESLSNVGMVDVNQNYH